jgi:cardiolipin synthase (CMP-forming)
MQGPEGLPQDCAANPAVPCLAAISAVPDRRQKVRAAVTIPNLITIARLFLVPFTIWLIVSDEPVTAFWFFILAGVSDAVDGFLARQFNMRSVLGSYLDPLADKVLLVSIYVTCGVLGEIPLWVTILVVSRDILIIGAVILAGMLGQPIEMRPRLLSKANTAAQIVLAGLVLGDLAFSPDLSMFRSIMVIAVGVLTIASTFVYAVDWVRHMGTSSSDPSSADGSGGR